MDEGMSRIDIAAWEVCIGLGLIVADIKDANPIYGHKGDSDMFSKAAMEEFRLVAATLTWGGALADTYGRLVNGAFFLMMLSDHSDVKERAIKLSKKLTNLAWFICHENGAIPAVWSDN